MSTTLSQLRNALRSYAARFDPALLSARDAGRAIEHAAAIKNMAATIEALAASRVAESKVWSEAGDRSAAHHLARTTGVSVAQASDTLQTAQRLPGAPATEAALRTGELSLQQAAVITDAVAVNPNVEDELLGEAGRASLGELRDTCARTKATGIDLEVRRRRIHERRSLRHFVDAEGAWNLHVRDNPERGAELIAALAPTRDRLFREARSENRRERLEAYASDALYDVVTRRAEGRASGRPKVIVRVDLAAMLRGAPREGEVCEIAGYGPIAVSAVRDLVATKNPILAAVVTKGRDVVSVAHLGRRPTAHQQTALQWQAPACEVEGCHESGFLEWDHTVPWAETHHTTLRELGPKCPHHHWLKTNEGWDLVPGEGKRAFVPPGDPRHPRRAHAPPRSAA